MVYPLLKVQRLQNRAARQTVTANTEFKKTTTATETVTSLNKRIYEQFNGFARAVYFLAHFFAVLCKTTT